MPHKELEQMIYHKRQQQINCIRSMWTTTGNRSDILSEMRSL